MYVRQRPAGPSAGAFYEFAQHDFAATQRRTDDGAKHHAACSAKYSAALDDATTVSISPGALEVHESPPNFGVRRHEGDRLVDRRAADLCAHVDAVDPDGACPADPVFAADVGSSGAERFKPVLAELLLQVSGLSRVYERSDSGVRQLEGLASTQGWLRRADLDPQRLSELDERMGLWMSLARRFKRTPQELPEVWQQWQQDLAALDEAADLNLLVPTLNACLSRRTPCSHLLYKSTVVGGKLES